jgi:integrase
LSVYKRGNVYWYKFWFANRLIRESTKTHSKTLAKEAEKKRRRDLENGYNNISEDNRSQRIRTLKEAADEYLTSYKARHTPNAARYVEYCIKHLTEHMGSRLLVEITTETAKAYQLARLNEGAAGKTINEEVGELFRIMGDAGTVVRLKLAKEKKLKLKQREDVGRALSHDEEKNLLEAASQSKSPLIYPALTLALNTGLRDSEMRCLQWQQIDFFKQGLTVGRSKTAAGTGRTIPINSTLLRVLAQHKAWYEAKVGSPTGGNYVFPGGSHRRCDPRKPLTSFKTAWNKLKEKTGITIRLHDTRHTFITKLAESGAGDETIMAIAGHVSRRMLSRYAHIRTEAKRKALESIAVPFVHSQQPTIQAAPTIN